VVAGALLRWRVCAALVECLRCLPRLLLLFRPASEARNGDLVGWHVGGSVLFLKRGLRPSCCSAATPVHLAGRGGEEVAWSLPWTARVGVGPLREPLEFWLSTVFHPRRRGHATASRGHRSGRAVLDALRCASLLLFMRSFSPASSASKPPVRPSGFVPSQNWGGVGAARQAISGKLGSDCLFAFFDRVLVVKVKGHVVIFISSGPLCKTLTAE
jgi:hypothetical protein